MSDTKARHTNAQNLLDGLAGQPPVDQVATRRLAEEALALALAHGERLSEARALLAGASWHSQLIDPQAAWISLQRAEHIFRAHGMAAEVATCQVAMSRALYDLGQERQADVMAQVALQESALPAVQRAKAYLMRFLAQGRMGQIEAAYACLVEQAIPVAQACGDVYLLASAIASKAWVIARLAHSTGNLEVPLPAHASLPPLKREPATLAQVQNTLDQARAVLPPGVTFTEIEIIHHYALGLTRDPGLVTEAARALEDLARQVTPTDPPLAAWGYLCAAMVLHDCGLVHQALALLPNALSVADSAKLTVTMRDVLYYQSLCHEAAGDPAAALAAFKWHYALLMGSEPFRSEAHRQPSAVISLHRPGEVASEALHRLRPLEPAYLKRAVRMIELRVAENIGVAEVVQGSGVSRRTLDDAFKSVRGTSLSAFLKRKKLEFAADLVLHTDRPIREIAASMGYRSAALFAKSFRDLLGMLPSQWRSLQAQPGTMDEQGSEASH